MEAGGEEGEGRVHVLWGRNVRSIQPFRMAGCRVGWKEGRGEGERRRRDNERRNGESRWRCCRDVI